MTEERRSFILRSNVDTNSLWFLRKIRWHSRRTGSGVDPFQDGGEVKYNPPLSRNPNPVGSTMSGVVNAIGTEDTRFTGRKRSGRRNLFVRVVYRGDTLPRPTRNFFTPSFCSLDYTYPVSHIDISGWSLHPGVRTHQGLLGPGLFTETLVSSGGPLQ